MALVMTGVSPYKSLNVPDPVAVGIDQIVMARHWSAGAAAGFTGIVKLGALAGLTSVILVMMMGQTRIFYAMSKDGLLPWFGVAHVRFGTPYVATVMTGIFVALCGGLMPMSLVGELVSIGTLLAFTLVCIGIPILRITSPDTPRPFKTPRVLARVRGRGRLLPLGDELPAQGHLAAAHHLAGDRPHDLQHLRVAAEPAGRV